FGEQRYGILGNSAQLGLLLLKNEYAEFCKEFIGDPELIHNLDWKKGAEHYRRGELQSAIESLPKKMGDEHRLLRMLLEGKSHRIAVSSLPRTLLRLFLSAAQSHFFDQLLRQRLPDLDRLTDGDIAVKHINGACFQVEHAADEQSRVDNFEISPSAPLFGSKVLLASGEPGQRETALLKESGLTLNSWKISQGLTMPGERRPLRIPLENLQILDHGKHFLTLSFILPKGSYATSVLRELIKPC
ncbi:MAG: tRNA pseudouridine(13) synthase TruD, partial [Desulfuromusa sp.]|nr:tRNA pseudouridine(13) synthase TruD [Desulfuromusa sp.]